MTPLTKKILAAVTVCVLAFVAYYGTYLPLQKSQSFIGTIRAMGGVRSLEELERLFSLALDIPSPIGHEELVRNMSTEIVSFVGRGGTAPAIEEELSKFVTRYFAPIITRGKGMSFEQDIYILGTLQRMVYQHTGKKEYLDAAEQYFLQGLELGPRRPQFLYALSDIYLIKQDVPRLKKVTEQIHEQWPGDARAAAILEAIQAVTSTPAASTKKK
ncbi:MAG: hypothetical protein HYY10_02895 [Candidatus Liptonbacteria bacterium]|nr:hypothetical protein [Candidatus Liptonbacteria bacterium]